MKTLCLIRHAQSSHSDGLIPDAERPLNKRGKKEAPVMANVLKKNNIQPDLFVSSPAKRALTTAKLFAEQLNYKMEEIEVDSVLYSFQTDQILSFIAATENKVNSLALFSHNPTVTEVVNFLSGENLFSMPTCAIAAIEFNTDHWSDIDTRKGRMIFMEYPELHKEELDE